MSAIAGKFLNDINQTLKSIRSVLTVGKDIQNFSQVKSIVANGMARDVFPLGTIFVVPHTTRGDILFEVVGYDYHHSSSDPNGHTMTLFAKNTLPDLGIAWSGQEAAYTFTENKVSGTYNCIFDTTVSPAFFAAVKYDFSLTQTMPAGTRMYFKKTPIGGVQPGSESSDFGWNYRSSTDAFDTVKADGVDLYSPFSQYSGSSIDLFDFSQKYGEGLGYQSNDFKRSNNGGNNYKTSFIRYWLNSSDTASKFYSEALNINKFLLPPAVSKDTKGFLNGIDISFFESLTKVNVVCKANNIYENPDVGTSVGSNYTVEDFFFLPSLVELGIGGEGLELIDSDGMRIRRDSSGTPQRYSTRDPYTADTSSVSQVTVSGTSVGSTGVAKNAKIFCPMCVIG